MEHLREQAAVLALVARTKGEWYKTASLIEEGGSALRIVEGRIDELDWFDHTEVKALGERVNVELLDHYLDLMEDWRVAALGSSRCSTTGTRRICVTSSIGRRSCSPGVS